jgi:UDP-N-acetylmuramoyl-L-alanyl-D-glutamate--2,6-diaminopimelate ligase
LALKLADILPELRDRRAQLEREVLEPEVLDRKVLGITSDSRRVAPGFVFFALHGAHDDGLAYAQAALDAGAVAIVSERPLPTRADACVIVEDARLALAQAAARFYRAQPAHVIAVTGTSGKTSVAAFVRQIWSLTGAKSAALGTTGLITDAGLEEGALTTPDPVALHETLADLAQRGITHLAMEASSHGLDQHRLDGVRLSAGAFTNLSRDHLDYHPDLESYLAAKMRLFGALLAPGQPAVIDADSDYGARVIALCEARGLRVFTIGRAGRDIRILEARAGAASTQITVWFEDREREIQLPLAGDFMASNALVAAGLCIATGSEPEPVFAALERLQGAPGRLEQVGSRNGAPIFVDYAHKPDALEKVLKALRPLTQGRLLVVFGCGGDRDRGKRAIMGDIAARNADVVIVTDDNPRSENPAAIRAEILIAAPAALEIADRGIAIARASALLAPRDALVIAGKGHETGQIIGGVKLPFSDKAAALQALAEAQ